jgi:hypothetical protein
LLILTDGKKYRWMDIADIESISRGMFEWNIHAKKTLSSVFFFWKWDKVQQCDSLVKWRGIYTGVLQGIRF